MKAVHLCCFFFAMNFNLITILGHTAASKTALAAHLAHKLNTEIISGDSRQVYRGMDLGTGKDIQDYTVEGKQIPYHLIDIVDAGAKYNVFEFQNDFVAAYKNIIEKGKTPVLCGGTGMYIESVLKGYKLIQVPVNEELREKLENKSLVELSAMLSKYKKLHNKSDVDTVKRAIRAIEIGEYYLSNPEIDNSFPKINSLVVGVKFDREVRRKRISMRLKTRLAQGMIEEVRLLLKHGVNPDNLIYYGLEYKFLTLFVTGKISYQEMFDQLETAIHQFAKRQMTWFRGMEKKGTKIHWLDGYLPMEEKINRIIALLEKS